tara:strand:+ start:1951 stop:2160 length:210 start_codon:yes stop_codon:yes gene_type:complete
MTEEEHWTRLRRGAYISGGYMIISESIVGVDSFGYDATGHDWDWCLFVGGVFISSHKTLWEAKFFSEWI